MPVLTLQYKLIALLVGLLAFAGAGAYCWHLGDLHGIAQVTSLWNTERVSVATQSLKLSEQATRETLDMQAKADQQLKDKNAKIRALNTAVSVVLASLSDRPDRPAGGNLPEATGTGSNAGCTGAKLYRSDAEAFVRESARADIVLADLGQCQAAYSNAREALNASTP